MELPSELARLVPDAIAAEPITGSGSNRQYWRIATPAGVVIGTLGTNRKENEAFIYLAECLKKGGTSVPQILAVSPDRMAYVQTSVGSKSLFDCLYRTDLIAKAMKLLATAQQTPGIDPLRLFPVAEMDRRSIMWDLNYFKYCFLKTTPGLEIDEPALEDDFEKLAEIILKAEPRGLLLRDFQSRNVMVGDDRQTLSLIDFQGARLGPAHYDVASFLWQARARFSAELRQAMVEHYCAIRRIDVDSFTETLRYFVAFRLMQALGAYGFRGRFEGKEHFQRPIPPAIESLRQVLRDLDLPSIADHLSRL